MFVVHHYNFDNRREFATWADAEAFVLRAYFDAVVYRDGVRVASFSSIGGWGR
jgi:hypothetical protein